MTAYEAKWDEIKNRVHLQRLSSNAFFKFVMSIFFYCSFLYWNINHVTSCHIYCTSFPCIWIHHYVISYITYHICMHVWWNWHSIIYQYFTIPLFVDIVIMSCHIIYHLLYIISWNVSFNGHLPESKLQEFHTFTESFTDIQPDFDKYIWPLHCGRDHRGCEIRTILLKVTG